MSLLTQASLVVTPNANKSGKLYSVIPSNGNGDFTVTRATTATRVNSTGLVEVTGTGMVRRDYSLGSCPNLLLEPQRTNVLQRSEEFNDAYWTKLGVGITANTTNSPSGILNADTLKEDASTGVHELFRTPFPITAGTHTLSIFVKNSVGSRFINLSASGITTDYASVRFSPSTATLSSVVVSGSFTNASATFQTLTNGWYRVSLTYSTTSNPVPQIALSTDGSNANVGGFGVQSYTGDNTSEIFIWGAQLEAGAYATSYIPTTSASVTRNADVITRDNVFTNGLITASGGTWFLELRNNVPLTRDANTAGLNLDTILGTNGFSLRNNASATRLTVSKYIASARTDLYVTTTNTCKIAIKWNGTTADIFENGTKVVSATAFTTTAMQLINGTSADVSKNINQMALFPTPLTDTQCTQLTTL